MNPEDSKTPKPAPPVDHTPKAPIEALGGRPLKFAPISTPTGPGGEAPAPPKPQKHDPLFDGPAPEVQAARQLVADFAAAMQPMRGSVLTYVPRAAAKLAEIKSTPTATAEAKAAGVDLAAAGKLLDALTSAFGIED